MWLWSSRAGATADEVNRAWQAFLRRFDIEHTFRFLKQQLGWTRPKLRDPAAADRWTWLVIAAYAQLHLARDLAADIRLPWQQPCAARPPHPGPGPPGVPPHPPGPARSRQRAETLPARTPDARRVEEPAARHPPRRRQDRQARGTEEEDPQAGRLNNNLRPYRVGTPLGQNFPSKHAANMFALAAICVVILVSPPHHRLPERLRLLLAFAALALATADAVSVIANGAHTFTDTLAGAAVGTVIALACALLFDLAASRWSQICRPPINAVDRQRRRGQGLELLPRLRRVRQAGLQLRPQAPS